MRNGQRAKRSSRSARVLVRTIALLVGATAVAGKLGLLSTAATPSPIVEGDLAKALVQTGLVPDYYPSANAERAAVERTVPRSFELAQATAQSFTNNVTAQSARQAGIPRISGRHS